jgi:serine/threonine-protein kinase HipA
LHAAVLNGTAMGGARPKALLRDGDTQYLAKFATSDDPLDVVGAEAASIHLAKAVGIPVTNSRIEHSLGKKVLLLERFDRLPGERRRMVVSATTILRVPETFIPMGSYPMLLDALRSNAVSGANLGRHLFLRIAFNIAISNSDDHLRNHAAFWDGQHLELTPAYDLSPVSRTGESSFQALAYGRTDERRSNLSDLIKVCAIYDLTRPDAIALIDSMLVTMTESWSAAADAAELTTVSRHTLWGHQFLNPGALYGVAPHQTSVGFQSRAEDQVRD